MLRALQFCFKIGLLLWAGARLIAGYIDPNTGGMLFQLLAGFIAVFSAVILFFSRQIRMSIARFARHLRGNRPQ